MTIIDKINNADARYSEMNEIQRRVTSLRQAINISGCEDVNDFKYMAKNPITNFWFMKI